MISKFIANNWAKGGKGKAKVIGAGAGTAIGGLMGVNMAMGRMDTAKKSPVWGGLSTAGMVGGSLAGIKYGSRAILKRSVNRMNKNFIGAGKAIKSSKTMGSGRKIMARHTLQSARKMKAHKVMKGNLYHMQKMGWGGIGKTAALAGGVMTGVGMTRRYTGI